MQLAKVKIGDFYSCSEWYSLQKASTKWKAVDKLPAEPRPGRSWPVAVLENASGQQMQCQARNMIPWAEYLEGVQIRKQGSKEMLRKVSQLQELIGEGFHVEALGHDAVDVRFSQQAIEASLTLLDAKHPTKGQWPTGDGDWKACTLLGRRLTRAFSAGHTASWMAVYLKDSGYVAQVNFGHQDLDAILEQLSGSDSSSALSSLFS
jgi:hypothetical protein